MAWSTSPIQEEILLGPGSSLLEGRSGRGVAVAVIDSGIHPGHPHVGGLAGGIAIREDASRHGDVLDRLGHGTAVAAAIHEKAPGAAIYVVRVFHEKLSTTLEALLDAIDWAVARKVRLVNLSLGTANPENAASLTEAVVRARDAGVVIVSALEDGSRVWYPGSLRGVVGVALDWECPRDSVRLRLGGPALLAKSCGYPRPIPGVPSERNLKGVSFAVANTTGLLARALEDRGSLLGLEGW